MAENSEKCPSSSLNLKSHLQIVLGHKAKHFQTEKLINPSILEAGARQRLASLINDLKRHPSNLVFHKVGEQTGRQIVKRTVKSEATEAKIS